MSGQASGTLLTLAAVSLFSTSALLVRLSGPVPGTEVTFWRLLLAGCVVLVAARVDGQVRRAPRVDVGRFMIYGLITAAHFLLYILSLSYTSVSNSLALVYTAPAFVAAFSTVRLHEKITHRQAVGIAVVISGVAVLSGFDLTISSRKVLGDAMAIGSAAAFGLYSVAGRGERGRYPLLVYAGGVYLCASLWLLPAALPTMSVAAFNVRNVLAIVALAVLPLAVGHTLYNAALRRIHAAEVNVLSTLEVVGGTFLVWAVRHEAVPLESAVGVAITLAGVLIVIV